ncbi:MAG: NAD(P)-dependent oxidoreductase [Sphingomonadaceae bacterium]|jgi:nucleoside-diphosphate-sugar epimerase|nr:NAD(P)-dependent oxidoreductase [Sphingomonadaceae bacterium]
MGQWRVLVTGGAGYIGSILVEYLLQMNCIVTVIDNFMFGQTSLNHLCDNRNLKIVNGDIRNPAHMAPLLKEADIIIPLAALVGAPLCNKDVVGADTTNKDAMFWMLNAVSNDQRIIMPTTNSAYGTGDENNFCTEESPLRPISKYAIDKVAVEERLMERENSISYRLATVFGMSPRMRTDLLVNDLTYRAVNDGYVVIFEGHFKRNYIHVRDICEAFLHAIYQFEDMKSNIYNVGLSSANVSKLELCEIIKKQIPNFTIVEGDIKKDPDQRNYIVSNEKLEATGWAPYYTLDNGVEELIKGYQYLKNNKHGNV